MAAASADGNGSALVADLSLSRMPVGRLHAHRPPNQRPPPPRHPPAARRGALDSSRLVSACRRRWVVSLQPLIRRKLRWRSASPAATQRRTIYRFRRRLTFRAVDGAIEIMGSTGQRFQGKPGGALVLLDRGVGQRLDEVALAYPAGAGDYEILGVADLQRLALSGDSAKAVQPSELQGSGRACHWNGRAAVVEFPRGSGHRGYAAMVDGSGLTVACWCSHSMGGRWSRVECSRKRLYQLSTRRRPPCGPPDRS